jgi:hypothetical protein
MYDNYHILDKPVAKPAAPPKPVEAPKPKPVTPKPVAKPIEVAKPVEVAKPKPVAKPTPKPTPTVEVKVAPKPRPKLRVIHNLLNRVEEPVVKAPEAPTVVPTVVPTVAPVAPKPKRVTAMSQLWAQGKAAGIPGYNKMKKADLLAALQSK